MILKIKGATNIKAMIIIGLMIITALFISMFITTPDTIGPLGITLWFTLAFIGFSFLFAGVSHVFLNLISKNPNKSSVVSFRRGVLVSLYLVMLLALNSLHQLSVIDIVLVTILIFVVEFYFYRQSHRSYE